jgi:predicted RNA binding protein YcfA (HicA-like mRNA interferase family)
MPKLPVLSGEEVIRMLETLGFERARQKGSHVILRRAGIGCVVPLHRELKSGTLTGIIRQSGLTADEFLSAAQ